MRLVYVENSLTDIRTGQMILNASKIEQTDDAYSDFCQILLPSFLVFRHGQTTTTRRLTHDNQTANQKKLFQKKTSWKSNDILIEQLL